MFRIRPELLGSSEWGCHSLGMTRFRDAMSQCKRFGPDVINGRLRDRVAIGMKAGRGNGRD